MKAYVLAAGYATRMYPLTRDVPKGLLEVAGAPILTHLVRRLGTLDDLSEIVVVTNARFHDPIVEWARGQDIGVPLRILDDGTTSNEERLGAIGDLRFALDRVPLQGEDAIVLASDNLHDFDLRVARDAFEATHRTTLLVRRVTLDGGPSRYNEVTLDAGGRVIRFREKPSDPRTDLSAIALYLFRAEDLARLDEYLLDGNPDAPGHFIAWLVERSPVQAVPLAGQWFDVGGTESLAEARRRFRTR